MNEAATSPNEINNPQDAGKESRSYNERLTKEEEVVNFSLFLVIGFFVMLYSTYINTRLLH